MLNSIDGCVERLTVVPGANETYDQCQVAVTNIKTQVDNLVTANDTAQTCKANKITEFLALPNTYQWRWDVEAI